MKIDYQNEIIIIEKDGKKKEVPFSSKEAFSLISDLWIRVGWDTKYVYSFTWLGRPIIQLPEDLIRLQELIYSIKPKNIIETGVAHGGGLMFYSTIMKCIYEEFKVIGVDIEIREKNRKSIEEHELYKYITLIEGNSISQETLKKIESQMIKNEKSIIILDSNHTKQHVLNELNMYSNLMNKGSIFIVADGIMKKIVGAPRTEKSWEWDNPLTAIDEFLKINKEFKKYEFKFPFNEGLINQRVTYWPSAFLIKD